MLQKDVKEFTTVKVLINIGSIILEMQCLLFVFFIHLFKSSYFLTSL